VALLTLGKHQTQANKIVTRVASTSIGGSSWRHKLSTSRLQLEACGKSITTAAQVVWLSDGAQAFGDCIMFCHCAVGILDFIMPCNIYGKLQLHTKTVILPGLSDLVLPGCVINCVTGLASASSKNSTG